MGGFTFTADNSLCFKSRQGGFWFAPLVGKIWEQAVKIPMRWGKLNPCDPGVAADGSLPVFYSIEPGARGGTPTDLYLSLHLPDGSWTKP